VRYDSDNSEFYVPNRVSERIDATFSRDALAGIGGESASIASATSASSQRARFSDVDHFLPHTLLVSGDVGANLNGVWNLVLACRECNRGEEGKLARVPKLKHLERLHRRNNYLIESHHPLRDTLMSLTGRRKQNGRRSSSSAIQRPRHCSFTTGTGPGTGGGVLSGTVAYYGRKAAQYFAETVGVDMSARYAPFLAPSPSGGRISTRGAARGVTAFTSCSMRTTWKGSRLPLKCAGWRPALSGVQFFRRPLRKSNPTHRVDAFPADVQQGDRRPDSVKFRTPRLCRALRPGGIMSSRSSFATASGSRTTVSSTATMKARSKS
jgi:hypothetical protein